jgi:hypothetical protein
MARSAKLLARECTTDMNATRGGARRKFYYAGARVKVKAKIYETQQGVSTHT